MDRNIKASLKAGKNYGKDPNEVYEECCAVFGWNRETLKSDYWLTSQWAYECTLEGNNVWFIPHTNWSGTCAGHWKNVISDDWNHIYEINTNPEFFFWHIFYERRIVFARNENDEYIFIGVFDVESVKDDDPYNKVKTYVRISETYEI